MAIFGGFAAVSPQLFIPHGSHNTKGEPLNSLIKDAEPTNRQVPKTTASAPPPPNKLMFISFVVDVRGGGSFDTFA